MDTHTTRVVGRYVRDSTGTMEDTVGSSIVVVGMVEGTILVVPIGVVYWRPVEDSTVHKTTVGWDSPIREGVGLTLLVVS
jgi:hypothetical protein